MNTAFEDWDGGIWLAFFVVLVCTLLIGMAVGAGLVLWARRGSGRRPCCPECQGKGDRVSRSPVDGRPLLFVECFACGADARCPACLGERGRFTGDPQCGSADFISCGECKGKGVRV